MVKLVKRDGIAMPLLADGKGVSIRKSIFCIMVLLMEDHDESDALLYETEDVPLELPYTKCWNTPIEMSKIFNLKLKHSKCCMRSDR